AGDSRRLGTLAVSDGCGVHLVWRGIYLLPELLARFQIECRDNIIASLAGMDEDAITDHYRIGIADSHFHLPNLLQTFRPNLWFPEANGHAVAIRSAPLRPILGGSGYRIQKDDQID